MKIIIVGSGIAGMTAAIFLSKDHNVVLLEKYETNNEVGVGLQLAPNAVKLLLKYSSFSPRATRGIYGKHQTERDFDDCLILDMPIHVVERFGAPVLNVHRHDLIAELQRILAEDCAGVQIVRGAEVVSVDTKTTSVTLRDGSVIHGDVVVGADGAWSRIRNHVLSSERILTPAKHSVYRLTIPTNNIRKDPELSCLLLKDDLMIWHGADRRVIAYVIRDRELLNIAAFVPARPVSEGDVRHSWDSSGSKEDFLAQFADVHSKLRRLFALADEAKLWRNSYAQPYETWSKDSTVIIGDAAHPMLTGQAQGASQAVEDGEALAYFLKGAEPANVPCQLRRFHLARIGRVTKIQKASNDAFEMMQTPVKSPDRAALVLKKQEYTWGYQGISEWLKQEEEKEQVHVERTKP